MNKKLTLKQYQKMQKELDKSKEEESEALKRFAKKIKHVPETCRRYT